MQYIAKDQKPLIAVLTSKTPTETETYASTELRSYLNLMTTASFQIIDEKGDLPVVAIGSAAESLGVKPSKPLGDDGFELLTVGDSLAIMGGIRGIIYGVYEFLERLGCRFFTPLCENIPSNTQPQMPTLNETQIPVLEYRKHGYADIRKFNRFAAKCRLNADDMPEYLGGGIKYAWFVHTFDRNIIHPDEYFDTHPEYFSLVNGKRTKEYTQLCLTNPDVLRIAIEKVKQALRDRPDCKIISVSQNDWFNNCECPSCRAIDEREGSSAGSLIAFVNAIAEAIEPEFPDVVVDTLAYQYSRPATKKLRPRHNVCVRLCSIEACFAHDFEHCDDKSRWVKRPDGTTSNFINDLRDWGKVHDRIYIWDYTTGFAHYPAPHPNWNVLQPNMKAFIANGVKGVYEQPNGAIGGGADMNELRAYIISKLLWNADTDVARHMREFTDFYYGKAGAIVREYIKAITDKCEKDNIHIGFNDQCDRAHLTDEMLDIYDEILSRAADAVKGDPIRAMRVDKIKLCTRWVRMKNRAMRDGTHNPDEINKFFEDWRAHGLTRIDEWCSAETTHRALLDNKWRGTEYYKHWTDDGRERL